MKKILYIDMDNVLVDFQTGIDCLSNDEKTAYEGEYDNVPGIFSLMDPMKDAVDAFNVLSEKYDTYILSTAPWGNHTAWSDKLLWVKRFLGNKAKKRLILSHNKHLVKGDYLIDDRLANGADKFEGELLQFGTEDFPDWNSVVAYLTIKD